MGWRRLDCADEVSASALAAETGLAVAMLQPPGPGPGCGRLYAPADAPRACAADVAATAASAVAVREVVPTRTRVVGHGVLAEALRRSGVGACDGRDRPGCVIETTGAASSVSAAVADVDALGAVVLAAPPTQPVIELRAYHDIHVRGLVLIGLPWAPPAGGVDEELVEFALAGLGSTWWVAYP